MQIVKERKEYYTYDAYAGIDIIDLQDKINNLKKNLKKYYKSSYFLKTNDKSYINFCKKKLKDLKYRLKSYMYFYRFK